MENPFKEIDGRLDGQRFVLNGSGEVTKLVVWRAIDELLDMRNELRAELAKPELDIPQTTTT